MKVLIAEDDPISRTVLRKTLERWGHDVFAAPDGAQAWAAFQHETFPVVISDWMMPGLDAWNWFGAFDITARTAMSPRFS